MGLEVSHRELQQHFKLLQFELAAAEFGGVERGLIIVPQQVLVVAAAARQSRGQQMFGQNYCRSRPHAIGRMAAFTNPVKSVAGSHHPGIRAVSYTHLTLPTSDLV